MTTSTYAIVHIPDNTPELAPTALGAHVTIRTAIDHDPPRNHPDDCDCDDCGYENHGALVTIRTRQEHTMTASTCQYPEQCNCPRCESEFVDPRPYFTTCQQCRTPTDCGNVNGRWLCLTECFPATPEPDDEPFAMPPKTSRPVILNITSRTRGAPSPDPAFNDLVPCTGGCGDLVPDTIYGDPYCDDCALALVPEDVRAMQPAPAALAHDIAALPDPQYTAFWSRLLHEYLADPPPSDLEIDALQDAVQDFAQDRDRFPSTPPSLAPAGPAAPPARLAG